MKGCSSTARSILLVVLLLTCLAVLPAVAQQVVNLPRATSPLVLFGFEGASGASGWYGLPCSVTTAHHSEGAQGMSFTMPLYQTGGNEWPSAVCDYNNGQGYATQDWSHYATLALDVWTDSSTASDVAVELRDTPNQNGWALHYTILPGQMNTISITLTDVNQVVDVTKIQQIILYSTRPPQRFTVTVDNIRLLPGTRPPLASFDLIYPNYRNLIMPNVPNIQAGATLQAAEYGISPSQLALLATVTSKSNLTTRRVAFRSNTATLAIPASSLPSGPAYLTVAVINGLNGSTLQSQSWTLQKLTQAQKTALSSYIDENNNTIVDGKPFFPLGWYNSTSDQYMYEIANSPFNCILDYGMDYMSKSQMLTYLAKVQQTGLKVIYCMNDVYPTATYISSWEGLTGNDQIAGALVQAYKTQPSIFSWYLNDELAKKLEPQLEGYYQRVATADPNHPTYIVLCDMPEVQYFPNTTDVMGVDPYPVPSTPLTEVSDDNDIATSAVHGHKPVWMVLQAFAWYQYNSTNPDRGHIPTAAELQTGRAPTYQEGRCMTYLALTHGAKGIIYYCYYDMRVLPQYAEMWTWMKSIGSEVKTLSPILLSPSDLGAVRYSPSSASLHTKLKVYNGEVYLMAVNPDNTACTVTFQLKNSVTSHASTMFENGRVPTVNVAAGTLTDTFQPLGVHVYDLGRAVSSPLVH